MRNNLSFIIADNQKRIAMKNHRNSRNFREDVLKRNGETRNQIKFDDVL